MFVLAEKSRPWHDLFVHKVTVNLTKWNLLMSYWPAIQGLQITAVEGLLIAFIDAKPCYRVVEILSLKFGSCWQNNRQFAHEPKWTKWPIWGGCGVIIAGMILHTDMSLRLEKRHFIRKITDGGFVLNHDTFRKDFVLFYTKNLVSFYFLNLQNFCFIAKWTWVRLRAGGKQWHNRLLYGRMHTLYIIQNE